MYALFSTPIQHFIQIKPPIQHFIQIKPPIQHFIQIKPPIQHFIQIESLLKPIYSNSRKSMMGSQDVRMLRANMVSLILLYMSNFKSEITYSFVKCGCSIYFFFSSANLISRGTDISKYFREYLWLRDNESRHFRLFNVSCCFHRTPLFNIYLHCLLLIQQFCGHTNNLEVFQRVSWTSR